MMGGGGVGAAITGAIGGAVSSVVGAVGGALSAIGGLFFEEAASGSGGAAVPTRRRCPRGSARGVRSRARRGRAWRARSDRASVAYAFTTTRAPPAWRAISARTPSRSARTSPSEKETTAPGTPVGNALLAHELAHVGQRGERAGRLAPEGSFEGAIERDADDAAASAVAALYAPGSRQTRTPAPVAERPPAFAVRIGGTGQGRGPGDARRLGNFTAFKQRLSNLAISTTTLASEVSALSDADRDKASKDLSGERIRLQREITSSRRHDRRRAGRSDEDRA